MCKKIVLSTVLIWVVMLLYFAANAQQAVPSKLVLINTPKLSFKLSYGSGAAITDVTVNGQKVVDGADGIYTSVKVAGITYNSLNLKRKPVLKQLQGVIKLSGIIYGDKGLSVNETWIFTKTGSSIKWTMQRSFSRPVVAEEAAMPIINFNSINTWQGAYQGYGGLAWFYLFNEKLCTYGVHTRSSSFWNSKTGNVLSITADAPGKEVAMKYTRTGNDRLACMVSVSDTSMQFRYDTGTYRRRFIRKATDVWAPFSVGTGKTTQSLTFSYSDYEQKYGRGRLAGLNGASVSAVLGTIARIGVIDSLHNGGNSWATPYGPICLHEQYIAQLGLGINDPAYLKGYQSCLDFYRDHAIEPDGRVYPRWAYTNEDAMPGMFNKYGFYEAQWGILMDSNPDIVTNVCDLYDMTGDLKWVKTHQVSNEKALDWLLKRDSNDNGLVEMMTDYTAQQKSSDWIDIIWASFENAFVNAKLYHALVKWAGVETELGNTVKANYYINFAAKLKASFNKPVEEGGFWDAANSCYVHWRDKDNSIHGRNMVTPVNFMAIAYGICDDSERKKLILDKIEAQMEKEKLFFWPICLTSYTPAEGKSYQYPFPEYENGDLFLSWGSVGVAAYAAYRPALAVKYVKNVLAQYDKDGLAFQRYGRLKQDGRGDDILAGNSLAIVGLYQAVYGINPLHNRFYLDPHITGDLSGTKLKYKYRDQNLTISLDSDNYAVSNGRFKIICNKNFGYSAANDTLSYFEGDNAAASLRVKAGVPITLKPISFNANKAEWQQALVKLPVKPVAYTLKLLKPNAGYWIFVNRKAMQNLKSNVDGNLVFSYKPLALNDKVTVAQIN